MRVCPTLHITFTGTGTFIVRLLESGIITSHDLARKYANELHANEIMLLAYYIAAINIEATYHGLDGGQYKPFNGIVLADTFQMSEDNDTLDTKLFTHNNERAQRQLNTDIRIIIGNPPYSAGQKSANDANANRIYPTLDSKIRETYAAETKTTLKNSLYDSYIRAIRWGTDRIGDKGILAYVTNGGYIDSNAADGLRKHLTDDFTHLYIYNLKGNSRTAGENAKREGGNVFDVRVGAAILIGIKNPAHVGISALKYHGIGDYLSRAEKLKTIGKASLSDMAWEEITPSKKHEWINQSDDSFDSFHPIGDKQGKDELEPVSATYSAGLKTNRDAWSYNSSRRVLEDNIRLSVSTYNSEVDRYFISEKKPTTAIEARDWVTYDSSKFKWDRINFSDLIRGRKLEYSPEKLRMGLYRPFYKQNVYFDPDQKLNNTTYQLPSLFPTKSHSNYGFYLHGVNPGQPFTLLATDLIPCLDLFGKSGQFFSRYVYQPVKDNLLGGLFSSEAKIIDGYIRIDNISDATLLRYTKAFGDSVTKDQIFASIYALLHSPKYQSAFKTELTRQLPRIPLPKSSQDFQSLAEIGEQLLQLHIHYELATPYPLHEEHSMDDEGDPLFYQVQKMRWFGRQNDPDKSKIIYNGNLTLSGIPDQAHEYMLGSRSALEWVIDRYRMSTHKASGITNDPNAWGAEHGNPRYIVDLIKKVTTVSVETMKLVRTLPDLDLT